MGAGALLDLLLLLLLRVVVPVALAFSPEQAAGAREPPPCSLNGEPSGNNGTCVCDDGWEGPACGQLSLLPAPPLAQQFSPAAALAEDNRQANATWGASVIGPVAGVHFLPRHSFSHTNLIRPCVEQACTTRIRRRSRTSASSASTAWRRKSCTSPAPPCWGRGRASASR